MLLTVFVSCYTYKDSVKLPGYEKHITNTKLAIVCLPISITVADSENVNDDLGIGKPEEVFMKFFSGEFVKQFKNYSSCSEVSFLGHLKELSAFKTTFKLPNDSTISLCIPKDGTIFGKSPNNPEFILFIDSLSVYIKPPEKKDKTFWEELVSNQNPKNNALRMLEEMEAENNLNIYDPSTIYINNIHIKFEKNIIPYNDDNDESLKYRGKYFYWDNQKGKLASYGLIFTKTFYHPLAGMRKNVWDASMALLARNVIRNSPFRDEKARYAVDRNEY